MTNLTGESQNTSTSFLKINSEHFIALALYTVLTIAFTFPLIINLTSSVFGPPEDSLYRHWNVWWFKKAIFDLQTSFYATNHIFHPEGVTLFFNHFSFANILPFMPFAPLMSSQLIFNLSIIMVFIMRGTFMFLLAKYVTGSKYGAFLAGCIFAFCPFFVHKSLHLHTIAAAQYFPLITLFLLKLIETPRPRYAAALGFFLALNSLSSWVYMVFQIPLFLFVLGYFAIKEKEKIINAKLIKHLAASFVLFLVLISYFVFPLVRELFTDKSYMLLPREDGNQLDLSFLFVPSDIHWSNLLLKDIFLRFYNALPGDNWEMSYFIGFSGLALIVFGLIKDKEKSTRLWLWFGIAFALITMGPSLRIAGIDTRIPLPFLLFYKLPLINLARIPSRYYAMALVPISVLAAFGLKALIEMISEKRPQLANKKAVLAAFVCLVLLIEYFPYPVEMVRTKAPPIYEEIKDDAECASVLELPMWGYHSNYKDGKYLEFRNQKFQSTHFYFFPWNYMLDQTFHGKKIFSGFVGRIATSDTTFYQNSVLKPVNEVDTARLQDSTLIADFQTFLTKHGTKYVLVHEDFYKAPELGISQEQLHFLHQWLNKAYEKRFDPKNRISIYRTS